jgi:hypothetical protein
MSARGEVEKTPPQTQPHAGRSRYTRMRPNHHVIIARPGADPRACARVERTTALVDEILASPTGRTLDPTTCSYAVHIAAGWLGDQRGFEATWEELDPIAFVAGLPEIGLFPPPVLAAMFDTLCIVFGWMARRGRMEPAAAEHCIRVLGTSRPALAPPPHRRRPIQRTRRFHRNWS